MALSRELVRAVHECVNHVSEEGASAIQVVKRADRLAVQQGWSGDEKLELILHTLSILAVIESGEPFHGPSRGALTAVEAP